MKLKFTFLVLFIVLIAPVLSAQRYAKKHFTFFSYNIYLDEHVRLHLSGLDNQVQIKTEGKQNKIDALLYHNIYNIVTKNLTDSLEIFFLAPNSLSRKAKYNLYGYPDISIQKAIRLSDTKYFLKLYVNIENDLFDKDEKRYPEGTFKPIVKIVAEIYSKEGFNPIQVVEGIAEASQPVFLKPSFLVGFDFIDPSVKSDNKVKSLKSLISEASQQVVWNIKYTKPKKL